MKSVFTMTENVANFRDSVRIIEDTEKGQPGLMVVSGRAGRGKTIAAQNYHAERGGVYINVWQDWTQTSFLQQICFEVNGKRPRAANACKVQLMEALENDPQTIFIDEADRLRVGRLEDLRDIHNETGVPIVLIGEEELYHLVSDRRRLWSRVSQEVQFGPITEEDVMTFGLEAAGLDIDMDACRVIVQKTGGDFRLVRNMVQRLEETAKARETGQVSAKIARGIKNLRSWR